MNGVCIVAMPVGDGTVTYKEDGSTAPLHQTLVYFGNTDNVSPETIAMLKHNVESIARVTRAFPARVIGHATLGEFAEEVVLTASEDIATLRANLLFNEVIREAADAIQQHPTYVSHISGMQDAKYNDWLIFDRIALWAGDDRTVYPLR